MFSYSKLIEEIRKINTSTGVQELTNPLQTMLLDEEQTINIAVIGQFKSGKSSLINSLIGENILPVDVVPATAIITQLQYSSRPELFVRFTDESTAIFPLSDLSKYTTEKENPNNIHKVALAQVRHPKLEFFQNVSFVDTPGLGSFYRHNSQTTFQWLPFTGVALVSVCADRPLSAEDEKLIEGVALYCPDVALVITKTDYCNHTQLEKIKKHITDSLNQSLGREFPIFEYSILKNTQEFRSILISHFISPFIENPEKKRDEILRFKIKTTLNQSLQYARLALQAAQKRESEKNSVSQLLMEINSTRRFNERELMLSATAFKGEVREKLNQILLPLQPGIQRTISGNLSLACKKWNGSLSKVTNLYATWLKTELNSEINRLQEHCYSQTEQIISESNSYFHYTAQRFRKQLDEKLFSVFQIHLHENAWQIDFTGVDKPDISIYRVFDSHLDSLLFFIPVYPFRRLIFRHFQKQITTEIKKNLHRYISDLTGKIIKSIENAHQQTLKCISNETITVEKILRNEKTNCEDLKKHVDRLAQLIVLFGEKD